MVAPAGSPQKESLLKHLIVAFALAYLMPAYSVLKRLATARDEMPVSSLKADGVAAVAPVIARELAPALGSSWSSGTWTLSSSLSVRFPGRCRLDLTPTDSTKVLTVAFSNGRKRTEGPAFAAAEVALEQVCAVLALRSGTEGETRSAIEHHLADLKIDTRQVSLGRFEGAVVYVLGDRSAKGANFSVYKQHFLPARLRLPDANGGWDVRFIDYTSQATGDWLPRVIEIYRADELYLRLTVMSADGKASLESTKF
jgi:hypothetical protein